MTSETIFGLFILLPTLSYLAITIASYFKAAHRHKGIIKLTQITAYAGLLVALLAIINLAQNGMMNIELLVYNGLGMTIRLDALSISMFGMIAIISFIIIKYSINYLHGDPRQGVFFSRIAATIASVQLLVLAGNTAILFISWVLTSIFLHRLLLFYKDRPRAVIAARKKFLVARVADLCLFAAAYLLYVQFGTGDLEMIFQQVRDGNYAKLEFPAILLAVAAIFKSAQLPFHSWLLEVMETPTPVSALLHAGLLNAGPFLLIRMAFVVQESTWAPLLLIIIGGLTALVASIIYMTQNSIKTALAYSSMAHMGFSLMSCGLGVFGAALLHLVAHSFYKAHSFLSSGSIVSKIKEKQFLLSKKVGSAWRMAFGIFLAFSIYIGCSFLWGIDPFAETPLLAIGAVISLGTAHLFTSIMSKENAGSLILSAIGLSLLVNFSFFFFESGAQLLLANQLPSVTTPSFMIIVAASAIIGLYTLTIFLQMRAPFLKERTLYKSLYIHTRNGFYMNIWFDKLVGAHRVQLRPESNLQYIAKQQNIVKAPAPRRAYSKAETQLS
ncbi:MAG: NAD(P)H-quinone oxidoreductase subunit 5 [Marivirga sp.]|jgi:NAD(P)H-quinone oxidoreductase subunit 5